MQICMVELLKREPRYGIDVKCNLTTSSFLHSTLTFYAYKFGGKIALKDHA